MYDTGYQVADPSTGGLLFSVLSFIFSWGMLFFVLVTAALLSSFYIVRGKTAAILETLGKPHDKAKLPGLHFKIPLLTQVVKRVNLQLQQLADEIEVKTKDNAFLKLPTKVQFKPSDDSRGIVRSHYELQDPPKQIKSFIFNTVRQIASGMTMDELYENQNTISQKVDAELKAKFEEFGFVISSVLVDQPQPSKEVQDSFNRVIASKRLLEAAQNEADATKKKLIGVAEGEKESKKLQGEGMAAMREAVATGLEKAMETLRKAHLEEDAATAFLLEINRQDTIAGAAAHGNMIIIDSKQIDPDFAKTIAATKGALRGPTGKAA